MQKRHFQALAAGLLEQRPHPIVWGEPESAGFKTALAMWRACVDAVADVCKKENGRFDRERFLLACGLSDGDGSLPSLGAKDSACREFGHRWTEDGVLCKSCGMVKAK